MSEDSDKLKYQANKYERRYYTALFIFMAFIIALYAYMAVYYIRQDNEKTRGYIKCVVTAAFNSEQVEMRTNVNKCKY